MAKPSRHYNGITLRQAEVLRYLLSLVLEKPPGVRTIQNKWSYYDYMAAEEWASTEHLSASDQPVRRMHKPACLFKYK